MSLPLWEECAWYVDFGDVDEEISPIDGGENHEEISVEDEYIPIDIVEENEHGPDCLPQGGEDRDVSTNVVTDAGVDETAEGGPDATVPERCIDGNLDQANLHAAAVEKSDEDDVLEDAPVKEEVFEEERSSEISIEIVELDEVEEPPKPAYKFPISRTINRRMYLYLGEIYKLPCDAIVVGQVESLTDKNDGNDVIFTLAGIELEPELVSMAPCTTGDSVATRGWQMPCEWIIHAVGPKYDERYLNASDHALFSAYKSALLLATEKEVRSLVIGTVYKQSKKYPRFAAGQARPALAQHSTGACGFGGKSQVLRDPSAVRAVVFSGG